MPQNPLYPASPLAFFPSQNTVVAGYTQRMQSVPSAAYSGQRTVQTYMATVSVLVNAGVWLHDGADTNPRTDMKGLSPFQLYKVFTTSMSSPDGDLPYKHGDYFVPNGNLVGLVANTQHPIRGVLPSQHFIELVVERKL